MSSADIWCLRSSLNTIYPSCASLVSTMGCVGGVIYTIRTTVHLIPSNDNCFSFFPCKIHQSPRLTTRYVGTSYYPWEASLLLLSAFRLIIEDSVGITWLTESLIRFWANVIVGQLEPPIPLPVGQCWVKSWSFQFWGCLKPSLVCPLLPEPALLTVSFSQFQSYRARRQSCLWKITVITSIHELNCTKDLRIRGRRWEP